MEIFRAAHSIEIARITNMRAIPLAKSLFSRTAPRGDLLFPPEVCVGESRLEGRHYRWGVRRLEIATEEVTRSNMRGKRIKRHLARGEGAWMHERLGAWLPCWLNK